MFRARLNILPLLLGLVLLLGGLSTPTRDAEAQIIPQSLEVDVFGGYYWFVSNLENLRPSPIFGARLGVNFLEYIGFEASVGYSPSTTWHGGRVAHYLNPHFDLVIHTTPWRVIPYFEVGAGFQTYIISETYRQGVPPSGSTLLRDPYLSDAQVAAGSLRYKARDIDFTFNVGGGLKFLIFDRGGLRIDGRYVLSIGEGGPEDSVPAWVEGDPTNVVYNDLFHHVELTGSFFVLLGGGPGKDSDGDGVPDKEDECPESPEDADGYDDEDGCPDRDNDQDGVADAEDQCPLVPEDRDGWRDTDGCPEADNDGDGIKDAEDGCPDQPEDPDGFQDNDGCPEVDNDQDGIPDPRDRCPLEAEDKDGFRDDDGCPEPDNDGDGVLDTDDKCPNAAEELNGIEDQDGCPEMDSDGDGVYDDRDRCPGEAEDLDGFEDADGCPDTDNDGDGLPDKNDFCPMQPEDSDGYEDGDGCPDFDNDEDGIADDKDKCPGKAEDDDGFEDDDGCPDYDNDQDGILDGKDNCPGAPETFNGFADDDGCPDEIPKELQKFTGAIPDIQFKVNSDELLSTSYSTLNQAANVLLEYKSVRIEIQGHASSEGDDEYNLQLSQRRSESVRNYLVQRGVDMTRLTAVGYGETQPVDTNRTESGRKRNRRVEFIIVQAE